MGTKTSIEWTRSEDGSAGATWTPIRARNHVTGKVGWHCEHATHGCQFCYAEALNLRLGTGLPFKPGHRKDIEIFLDEKMLLAPLRWKGQRNIFVCSMTDAFAEFVNDEWLDRMFAVAALAPQHTFQWLTKRSARMRRWANDPETPRRVEACVTALAQTPSRRAMAPALQSIPLGKVCIGLVWPLPHCWLGVSVEDQTRANERVPDLLATRAAVRFVSAEPLLGDIDFLDITDRSSSAPKIGEHCFSALHDPDNEPGYPYLDWIIAGAESGTRARVASRTWFQSIRDQCAATGTAFFMKQLSGIGGRAIKDMAMFPDDLQIREFPNVS
jgi:protein gp37